MRRISWILIAVGMVGCVSDGDEAPSPESGAGTPPPPVHPALTLTSAQEEGRVIYETLCWNCHGPSGRGDGPAVAAGSIEAPPTFHTLDFARASAGQLARRFRANLGEADEAHPHMQYVTSLLKPERFSDALSFVPALVYPPEIPGSALAGRRIYAFRCVGCHGPLGDGDGTAAASLIMAKPADFTADTLIARGDWDGLFRRITEGGRGVHGSSMPPWGVILSEEERWDLVAYLATFQIGRLAPPSWSP